MTTGDVFPFVDIARSVLETAPQVIFNPGLGFRFAFYWILVMFVHNQFSRTAALQRQLYGQPLAAPLRQTVIALAEGLIAGLVGSYVMTFFGVAFLPDGGGIIWVLGVAVALMLINPRLMCFAYAGGLVAVTSLLFGFPKVSIPPLMGLVAVLHFMESILIFIDGSAGATPVYLERKGQTVGAFYLQRSWAVPVALLILAVISPVEAAHGGTEMPDWWPLFRVSPEILAHPGAVFFLHALPAGLGYSDLALTSTPRVKSRRTALDLFLYSLALLAVSLAASRVEPLVWVAALFAPLGHEAVVRFGNYRESARPPYFVPPADGVMVLDTVPGSRAAAIGLGPGCVITSVNGRPVRGRDDLHQALTRAGEEGGLTLSVRPPAGRAFARRASSGPSPAGRPPAADRTRTLTCEFGPGTHLGVIPVPEPDDRVSLKVQTGGLAGRLVRRLFGGRGRDRGTRGLDTRDPGRTDPGRMDPDTREGS